MKIYLDRLIPLVLCFCLAAVARSQTSYMITAGAVNDSFCTGGVVGTTTRAISGTYANGTSGSNYQSERWFGNATITSPAMCSIPLQNGSYNITLALAEDYFSSPGSRIFSASINDTLIFTDLDLIASVGAFTADNPAATFTVTNGQAILKLWASQNNPKFDTIIIVPSTPQSLRRSIIGNLTSSALDQSAMAQFQGCLFTDVDCTMDVVVCYTGNGFVTPPTCATLPAGSYIATFAFERKGGTEIPGGAMAIVTRNEFSISIQ